MKLSILIITYNHGPFIRQALEGVLGQRVDFDYEIVVGEDNSTDGTREVVREFHKRYPNRIVPLLHDQNLGVMRNFQKSLAACRGQYLAIVDGDDYWVCMDKLQRQVDFLDQNPDHAICCHRVHISNEIGSGLTGIWPPNLKAGSYAIEDIIADNFIATCSVMYRWGSLGSLPDWFLDLKLGDWPLNILMARSGKIKLMDEVMAVYRVHSGGVWTSTPTMKQKQEIVRMMVAVDRHMNFQYSKAIRRFCAERYFDFAIVERLNGNRLATIKYLFTSLSSGQLRVASRWRPLMALLVYCAFGVRRHKKR